jgi:outer membrane beta-barrel protein
VTLIGSAITPQLAHALQGGEDPALLPVLIDKRFSARNRHQGGLLFSTSMADKFIESIGGTLTYGFNFSDLIGLEIDGGFFNGKETNILTQIRALTAGDGEVKLSDLYQTSWFGTANLMLVPFYGKMSFAAELDPSYDLFVVAGVGATGLRRLQSDGAYDNSVGALFNFGIGFRFYITRLIGLRLELRDYFFPDAGTCNDSGMAVPCSGMTNSLHFQGGVQFAFGGE